MMKKSSNTNSTTSTSEMVELFGTKIVRLHTGEDIVCGIIGDDQGNYILDNPLHLIYKRTTEGTVIMLLPWLPMEFIEMNIAYIRAEDILTVTNPKMKLIKYYEEVLDKLKNNLEKIDHEEIQQVNTDTNTEEDSEKDLEEESISSYRVLH